MNNLVRFFLLSIVLVFFSAQANAKPFVNLKTCKIVGKNNIPFSLLSAKEFSSVSELNDYQTRIASMMETKPEIVDIAGGKEYVFKDLLEMSFAIERNKPLVEVLLRDGKNTFPRISSSMTINQFKALFSDELVKVTNKVDIWNSVHVLLCGKFPAVIDFEIKTNRIAAIYILTSEFGTDSLKDHLSQGSERAPARNAACSHLYVGRVFSAPGGIFGIAQTYEVVGFSNETAKATIKSASYSQEVSCYEIPK